MNLTLRLTELANDLKDLDKRIVKDALELNREELFEHLNAFIEKRKELKKDLLHFSSYTIHNKIAQHVINKVVGDESFSADNVLKILGKGAGDADSNDIVKSLTELDDDELEELTWKHLYSWFGPHRYIEDLYEIGALILGISVPNNLERYVSEARESYALQNYLAVYAMCRTIVETAVRDIGQRKGYLPRDKGDVLSVELRNWSHMKNKVVPKRLKDEVGEIYDLTSGLIHGHKNVASKEAKDMLMRVLQIVQKLYEHYNLN